MKYIIFRNVLFLSRFFHINKFRFNYALQGKTLRREARSENISQKYISSTCACFWPNLPLIVLVNLTYLIYAKNIITPHAKFYYLVT